MESILDVARERASDAYAEASGTQKKQITPAVLTLIVDVAMEVLASCMKNSSAQQVVDSTKNDFVARLSIRRAMRRIGEQPNEQIISSVLSMAKKSTAQEIEKLHAVG